MVVAFSRPLGVTDWICLTACVGFVGLGCAALLKRPETRRPRSPSVGRRSGREIAPILPVPRSSDDDVAEPTPEERHALATTIAALESAGALTPGEADARMMWDAAQHYFPGEPVGFLEALASLAVLHDHGFAPRRITVIPAHVEYDGELLAAITASILTSLGHEVGEPEILVTLPRGDWEGEAVITFPMEGRRESVTCHYLVKYPPPDLPAALARFSRADDPRDLVCADTGYGTLLLAAIRPQALTDLNRCFPVGYEMFGPY